MTQQFNREPGLSNLPLAYEINSVATQVADWLGKPPISFANGRVDRVISQMEVALEGLNIPLELSDLVLHAAFK